MAKITKTRGRKPLAEGAPSLSFGRGHKTPASYNIALRREDGGFYSLSLTSGEAWSVIRFFAICFARERGWVGGATNDETAVANALTFLADTL